ncbi:BTB/POZ domain-containing protein [Acrasis kona]|uniref:BTB/POZ domain-containing protein n=1 Tax=Acrasis kona TaxID=1008807 RepID=A0AAW2YKE0_9EUKA
MNGGIVKLNVGGTIFTTLKSVVQGDDSVCLFSMMKKHNNQATRDDDGNVFIDRDPTHFRYILNYLRGSYLNRHNDMFGIGLPYSNPDVMMTILHESDFYGTTKLSKHIEHHLQFLLKKSWSVQDLHKDLRINDELVTSKIPSEQDYFSMQGKNNFCTVKCNIPTCSSESVLLTNKSSKFFNYFEVTLDVDSVQNIHLGFIDDSHTLSEHHCVGISPNTVGLVCSHSEVLYCDTRVDLEARTEVRLKGGDRVGMWWDCVSKSLSLYQNGSFGLKIQNVNIVDWFFAVSISNDEHRIYIVPDAIHPDINSVYENVKM